MIDRGVDNEFGVKMTKRTYILQVPPSPIPCCPPRNPGLALICVISKAATEKEKKDWVNLLQRVKVQPEP